MSDFDSLLRRCSEYHRFISAFIGDVLVPWTAERFRLKREFNEKLTAYTVDYSRLPRDWEEMVFYQFVAARLFCGRRLVREFLKSPRRTERLDGEDLEKLRGFSREGWRFSVCVVTKTFSGDFFTVADHPTEETFLVYSPGLSRLMREGCKTFVLQLFNNGLCFQTYAALHGYTGFDCEDLMAYARAAAPRAADVISSLENDPAPLFPLMLHSRAPVMAARGVRLRRLLKILPVAAFAPGGLAAEEKDGIVSISFGRWSAWPHFARAYFDRAAQRLVLGAFTEEGYKKAAVELGQCLPFDATPDKNVGMTMHLSMREILGARDPGEEYEEIFTDEEPSSPEIENLNRAVREMNDALNRGATPDLDEIARRFGVPADALRDVEKTVRDRLKALRPVYGEGLPGFTRPPPAVIETFRSAFADGDFADFPPVPADLPPEQLPDGGLAALPGLIQDSYEILFQTFDPTILTYTVYLLRERGGAWEDASRYAFEVLNLCGRSVLSGTGKRSVAAFVKRYTGKFMGGLLAECGLVEVDGDRVRASRFFPRWIRLREPDQDKS